MKRNYYIGIIALCIALLIGGLAYFPIAKEESTSRSTQTWEGILPGISTERGGTYALNIAMTQSTVGLDVSEESALTNTVQEVMSLTHTTSGTAAAGIGLEWVATQETAAANNEDIGAVQFYMSDVTATSEDASFGIELMAAGAAKAEVFTIGSTGVISLVNGGTINNSTNGIITIDEPSSATNTVVDIVKISHSTSGTAAAGIGTGLAFEGEDDGGAVQVGMTLDMVSTDVTAASEDYDFVLGLMDGGTASAERFRVDSGGIITQSAATAATNAVVDVVNISHATSGTADDGIGSGVIFTQETAAANTEVLASIDVIASDVSDATEDGEIIFSTMTAGAAATEKMRIHDTGEVEFQKGIVPDQVTADPCTGAGYPEGTIFYNSTANVLCYCSAANADLKVADDSACF